MNELATSHFALPSTSPEELSLAALVHDECLKHQQIPIHTDHLIHAGMYARTITMPPRTVLVGTLIQIPTTVIMVGTAMVRIGEEWVKVEGYAVLPASAGRKQMFISESAFIITMIFPTDAHTVEEAEEQFTSETALLLSRRQNLNKVAITGE